MIEPGMSICLSCGRHGVPRGGPVEQCLGCGAFWPAGEGCFAAVELFWFWKKRAAEKPDDEIAAGRLVLADLALSRELARANPIYASNEERHGT